MKNKIYNLGIAAAATVMMGAMFKMMHFPGAALLILAGVALLLFGFLPAGLKSSYKASSAEGSGLLSVVTWITAFVIFVSMVFKILHWPFAGTMMLIAIPFPFVVFLPVYLFTAGKNRNHSILDPVFVLMLLVLFSVSSALLAVSVTRYSLNEGLLMGKQYRTLGQSVEVLQHDDNERLPGELKLKAAAVQLYADECIHILLKADGSSYEEWVSNPFQVTRGDNRFIAAEVLLSDKGNSMAEQLAREINEFCTAIEKTAMNKQLAGSARKFYGIESQSTDLRSWSEETFSNVFLTWAILRLESIKANTALLRMASL
jgi:hypothetical protein